MFEAPRAARELSVRPAGAEGAPRPDAPALGRNSTRSFGVVILGDGAVGIVGPVAVSVRGAADGMVGATGSTSCGCGAGDGCTVRGWTGLARGRGARGRGAGGGKNVTRACVRLSSISERDRFVDTEVIETSAMTNSATVASTDAAMSVHRGDFRGKSNGYARRLAVCAGRGM